MNLSWSDISFVPDEQVVTETAAAWNWLIPGPWETVICCSLFGAVFLETAKRDVFWLDCPTGEVTRVAESAEAFRTYLNGPRDDAWREQIDEWFLTDFVQRLRDAGKRPGPGECYGFTIPPIFREGKYEVGNIFFPSAREWLTLTALLHKQLRDVPDGVRVQIKVVD